MSARSPNETAGNAARSPRPAPDRTRPGRGLGRLLRLAGERCGGRPRPRHPDQRRGAGRRHLAGAVDLGRRALRRLRIRGRQPLHRGSRRAAEHLRPGSRHRDDDPRQPAVGRRGRCRRGQLLRDAVDLGRRALRRLRVRGLQPGGRGDGVQEHLRARPAGPDHDAGEPPIGRGRGRRGRRQELRPRDLGRRALRRLRLGRRQPVGRGRGGEGRVRPRPPGPDDDPGEPPVGVRGRRRRRRQLVRSLDLGRRSRRRVRVHRRQSLGRRPLRSRPTSSCATSTPPRPRSRIARPARRARRETPPCPPPRSPPTGAPSPSSPPPAISPPRTTPPPPTSSCATSTRARPPS